MNRGFILVVLLGLTLSIGLWPLAKPYFPRTLHEVKNSLPQLPASSTPSLMDLSSPSFTSAGQLPIAQTCDGRGIAPELRIGNPPAGTVMFVVTMIDIDVPAMPGGKYYHWGVWGLPPLTTAIPSAGLPTGAVVAKNSAGQSAYAPACPPSGEHRYIFTVYALNADPKVSAGSTVPQLLEAIQPMTIASASLIGRYKR